MTINKDVSRETLKSCTIPRLRKYHGAYFVPTDNEQDFSAFIQLTVERWKRSGYCYKRQSSHNGYLPPYHAAVIPYCGRWGIGYIIASHHNKSKVLYKYYIKE